MGYLIFQILFFLLIAALLGFVIGWLLRGSRFQRELTDLDARWRAKLSEVEGERDRFAGEVTQANEARTKFEASAAEAKRLADTHEANLKQLRGEHETKLGLLSTAEERAGGLEKELADAKAALASQAGAGGDSQELNRHLAAAKAQNETLERDLQQAKEANSACRREVEKLEAQLAELERSGSGDARSGGALGLVGSTGSSTTGGSSGSGTAGETGGSSGRAPLGLVGSTDGGTGSSPGGGGAGSQSEPGFVQKAASPSHLAETGGQDFSPSGGGAGSGSSGSSNGSEDGERPEALSGPNGGVADDLKKISGVGPKLEKTLNGLGIYHFSQIAAFTPDHVTWVDKYLRFKGRIDRENWIEQAKILAAGGETEFSKRN